MNFQDTQEELLRLFLLDEGKRETNGKNRSPDIDQWNEACGCALGSPYCTSGPAFRIRQFCASQDMKSLVPKTGSSQKLWSRTNQSMKYSNVLVRAHDTWKPFRCMLMVFRSRTDPDHGHCAIVYSDGWRTDSKGKIVYGEVDTFEYNTNVSGDRDGDGVMKSRRSINGDSRLEFLGFIDLISSFEPT